MCDTCSYNALCIDIVAISVYIHNFTPLDSCMCSSHLSINIVHWKLLHQWLMYMCVASKAGVFVLPKLLNINPKGGQFYVWKDIANLVRSCYGFFMLVNIVACWCLVITCSSTLHLPSVFFFLYLGIVIHAPYFGIAYVSICFNGPDYLGPMKASLQICAQRHGWGSHFFNTWWNMILYSSNKISTWCIDFDHLFLKSIVLSFLTCMHSLCVWQCYWRLERCPLMNRVRKTQWRKETSKTEKGLCGVT